MHYRCIAKRCVGSEVTSGEGRDGGMGVPDSGYTYEVACGACARYQSVILSHGRDVQVDGSSGVGVPGW